MRRVDKPEPGKDRGNDDVIEIEPDEIDRREMTETMTGSTASCGRSKPMARPRSLPKTYQKPTTNTDHITTLGKNSSGFGKNDWNIDY